MMLEKPQIGIDICEFQNHNYLVTVDYFSKFTEVDLLTTMTSKNVITFLKKHCARYGIPNVIILDCGSQFISREFQQFTETWGIHHITSSPGHQQANGKAESAAKIVKQLLKKAVQDDCDQYLALLELRNTPRKDTVARLN